MEKIIIGNSDYTKEEMLSVTDRLAIGNSAGDFLYAIQLCEECGYTVKFETSIFRRIFCTGIYKITAYKNKNT